MMYILLFLLDKCYKFLLLVKCKCLGGLLVNIQSPLKLPVLYKYTKCTICVIL